MGDGFYSGFPTEGLGGGDTEVASVANGFPNRTDTTVSWVDGTRTLTLSKVTDTYEVWVAGSKLVLSDATKSIQISDVEGYHFIFMNAQGNLFEVLVTAGDPNVLNFSANAAVASLYWDVTNQRALLGGPLEERHGVNMDGDTHAYLHFTQGAKWISGLDITDLVTDGNGDLATSAQVGYNGGFVADEDLFMEIPSLAAPASIPVLYRSGDNGDWREKTADAYPMVYSGTAGYTGANGRAPFNEFTGSTWQLTEVSNGDFYLVHLFGTTLKDGPKIIAVHGQAEYSSVANAREGAERELRSINSGALPVLEMAPLATLICETSNGHSNAAQTRFRTTTNGFDYIDWRSPRVDFESSSGQFVVPSDPLLASVGALLKFDDADLTIVSAGTATAAVVGAAVQDDVVFNFGSGSMLTNGGDGEHGLKLTAVGGSFDFGTGDWTLECFGRVNPNGFGNDAELFAHNDSEIQWGYSPSNDAFFYFESAQITYFAVTGGETTLADGTFHHIAFQRTSGNIRVALDGVWLTGVRIETDIHNLSHIDVGFRDATPGPADNEWPGWLDEVRITRASRYVHGVNFVPPSDPFPTV